MLFVPGHWWHEVTSFPDQSTTSTKNTTLDESIGQFSMGLNYFYEPFYLRKSFQSKVNIFHYNRYYTHINGDGIVSSYPVLNIEGADNLKSAYVCDSVNMCVK